MGRKIDAIGSAFQGQSLVRRSAMRTSRRGPQKFSPTARANSNGVRRHVRAAAAGEPDEQDDADHRDHRRDAEAAEDEGEGRAGVHAGEKKTSRSRSTSRSRRKGLADCSE
jgi:hypothetical protein